MARKRSMRGAARRKPTASRHHNGQDEDVTCLWPEVYHGHKRFPHLVRMGQQMVLHLL